MFTFEGLIGIGCFVIDAGFTLVPISVTSISSEIRTLLRPLVFDFGGFFSGEGVGLSTMSSSDPLALTSIVF